MLKIFPSWKDFVVYEGVKKVLIIYSEVIKVLYGTVDTERLFYDNLYHILIEELELEFELNPYDSCILNKMINGKHCTIVWYIDNLKISHVDNKVVTSIIHELEDSFA